jgi:hypothetical protein
MSTALATTDRSGSANLNGALATGVSTARGFVYFTAVVDVASRRVLAHREALARRILEFGIWKKLLVVNPLNGLAKNPVKNVRGQKYSKGGWKAILRSDDRVREGRG